MNFNKELIMGFIDEDECTEEINDFESYIGGQPVK